MFWTQQGVGLTGITHQKALVRCLLDTSQRYVLYSDQGSQTNYILTFIFLELFLDFKTVFHFNLCERERKRKRERKIWKFVCMRARVRGWPWFRLVPDQERAPSKYPLFPQIRYFKNSFLIPYFISKHFSLVGNRLHQVIEVMKGVLSQRPEQSFRLSLSCLQRRTVDILYTSVCKEMLFEVTLLLWRSSVSAFSSLKMIIDNCDNCDNCFSCVNNILSRIQLIDCWLFTFLSTLALLFLLFISF